MRSNLVCRVLPVVASLAAVVSIGSCDKVPLLAPTASVMTIVSSRSVLPVNGTAQIKATVIEQSGTPAHNGTLVTFTTTLGTLEPQEAVTSNGQAVVTLKAGAQSGTASLVAFSGSARTETPITVLIGGAAATAVSVTANPALVPSTGGTVTIAATVSDADGNSLAGVPVSFSTTAGTLGATRVNSAAGGEATTTLTTSSAATVTATAGSRSATVAVAVNDAPTVVVTTTTTTPTVAEATVFSVVTTAPGSPISSASIDFGDGASLSLGSLTGTTSVSHVYTVAGNYTVVATAIDNSGQQVSVSTVITVVAQTPLNVTLTSSTTSPTLNTPVAFSATVTPTTVAIVRYEWAFGDGGRTRRPGGHWAAAGAHWPDRANCELCVLAVRTHNGDDGTVQRVRVIVADGYDDRRVCVELRGRLHRHGRHDEPRLHCGRRLQCSADRDRQCRGDRLDHIGRHRGGGLADSELRLLADDARSGSERPVQRDPVDRPGGQDHHPL